jgi:hypothetical protein
MKDHQWPAIDPTAISCPLSKEPVGNTTSVSLAQVSGGSRGKRNRNWIIDRTKNSTKQKAARLVLIRA